LQVAHDGDDSRLFEGHAADRLDIAAVEFVIAVTKVDAGDVHPGADHLADNFLGGRGWPNRTHDFRAFSIHFPDQCNPLMEHLSAAQLPVQIVSLARDCANIGLIVPTIAAFCAGR
jgi:hypothetical protein